MNTPPTPHGCERKEHWEMPPLANLKKLVIFGEGRIHPDATGIESGIPDMDVFLQ